MIIVGVRCCYVLHSFTLRDGGGGGSGGLKNNVKGFNPKYKIIS